jgi:LmbE family N-acetylglucosaminyl deacetylase
MGVRRLLVIAPHPDDETIGAGGVIQAALSRGASVKVVVLTNGDGQALAPLALRRRLVARPADYVTSGVVRESETLTAMRALGLPSSSVVFLGYPDRLLEKLWLSDWTTGRTFRSKYTRRTSSPYPSTYDSGAQYCGRAVLDDLRAIIAQFRPDLVVVPHPNDAHPDHRAASSFSRLALGELAVREAAYHPSVWAYLVHYGRFPRPRGAHPEVALLPPVRLSGEPNHWVRADLTPEQVQAKRAALQAYTSQLVLLRSFLPSFSRRNELFAAVTVTGLEQPTSTFLRVGTEDSADPAEAPVVAEPAEGSARRRVLGSADLVGVRVRLCGGQVWVTAHTRAPLARAFRYRLLVKLPAGQTETAQWPGDAVRTGRAAFSFPVDLEAAHDPAVLGFAAEVRRGRTLDRTGWHFVTLRGPAA